MKRILLGLVLLPSFVEAQGRFSFEAFLGGAHNFGSTLTIAQGGQPALELDAEYATRGFELPPYYAFRFGIHDEHGAWELQFTHHKLHLENGPPEIQHFDISHGLNYLVFGRALGTLPVGLRVLGGVVIAHPESEVRDEPFSPGYQLTGPAFVAAVGRKIDLTPWFFVTLDVQFLAARAQVPIFMGDAATTNISLHGLFGVGARF